MSDHPKSRPSFSPAFRWKIGCDVVLRTVLVLAVVVMVNYLGTKFFYHRFYLSSRTSVTLSPRTVNVLHSLTNRVAVTLYFDRQDEFYPDIVALLHEYQAADPKLSVRTVDYVRDAGEAAKVKEQYKLNAATDKNLVIFDYAGRVKIASGDALSKYTLEQMAPTDPKQKELEFRRKPVAFLGEQMFTAALLALASPQPPQAYFLQGDGEPSLSDNENFGYLKFGTVLGQNYIAVANLDLTGEAAVPMDCNLLIIAAPTTPLSEPELQKVDEYLAQGGRLLMLFNYSSIKQATGLEPILRRWGVNVVSDYVQDTKHTVTGQDVYLMQFGKHPVMDALAQLRMQMILPRPIVRINQPNPPANAPEVTELAFTFPNTTLALNPAEPPQSYPLMAAIEQKPVAGVIHPRGVTRIIVAGDSVFLSNYYIEAGGNRDFLNSAVNWLVDRPQLLAGIGPRPVTEFRLWLTRQQQRELRWLLLGALPGGVMFLGWLVWLVRRQ
jgi:hypothetical protein